MKRSRREGGGGEVALMAVITKAMGAFLVLVVIMLPDYVYVVSHGRSDSAAQQMLDAAAREAKQLELALAGGAATARDFPAMRQTMRDVDQKLAALKDEVASLSHKLGQADAEIRRLRLDSVGREAKQVEQALDSGNVTPQELAAMRRKLEDINQKLATLRDEDAGLRDRLDADDATIEQLKKEREALSGENDALKAKIAQLSDQAAELKDQAAQLRDQVEKLKSRPLKATVVTLSWSGCYGADIALYVQSKVGDRTSPPPSRIDEKEIFWPGDDTIRLRPSFVSDFGTVWWSTTDQDLNQRLTIWAKLLNPVYTPNSLARTCKISWVATSSAGNLTGGSWLLTDERPIKIIDTVDVRADGAVERVETKEEDDRKLDEAAYAGSCSALLCPFANFLQGPVPEANARPLFLQYVKRYLDAGDAAGPVFDAIASRAISVDDGYRWLGLFPYWKAARVEASNLENVAALRQALEQKKPPAIFVEALLQRVRDNLASARSLAAIVAKLPPFEASAPDVPAPKPSLVAKAPPTPAEMHARLATLAAQSVKEGALTGAQADAILAAADRKSKPSDAEIDKRVSDMKLPSGLAELLGAMIRSGDLDIDALPTAPVEHTPAPRRPGPVIPLHSPTFERDIAPWRN
jgi:archaellum component FlaC